MTSTIILLRLLIAHLLADFALQPGRWIKNKKQYGVRGTGLYYHVGVVGLLTWIFLWDWSQIILPAVITVTHFLIDWWKWKQPERTWVFVLDQAAHISVIVACWLVYTGSTDLAVSWLLYLAMFPEIWTLLLGYITVIWPTGYFIAQVTDRWRVELGTGPEKDFKGLQDAGMWIGWTERFIILTLILLNQYGAIGFLIAAKSVFRFSGKLKDGRERKEAEYILIGTLLSFALAITIGIVTAWLLEAFS